MGQGKVLRLIPQAMVLSFNKYLLLFKNIYCFPLMPVQVTVMNRYALAIKELKT